MASSDQEVYLPYPLTLRVWGFANRWYAASRGREVAAGSAAEAIGKLLLEWDQAQIKPQPSAEECLLAIARAILGRDSLQPTGNAELDLRQVPIWLIRQALEEAYQAGRAAAEQKTP